MIDTVAAASRGTGRLHRLDRTDEASAHPQLHSEALIFCGTGEEMRLCAAAAGSSFSQQPLIQAHI